MRWSGTQHGLGEVKNVILKTCRNVTTRNLSYEDVKWIELAQYRGQQQAVVCKVMYFGFVKAGNILTS
jgi:hypothetical protein